MNTTQVLLDNPYILSNGLLFRYTHIFDILLIALYAYVGFLNMALYSCKLKKLHKRTAFTWALLFLLPVLIHLYITFFEARIELIDKTVQLYLKSEILLYLLLVGTFVIAIGRFTYLNKLLHIHVAIATVMIASSFCASVYVGHIGLISFVSVFSWTITWLVLFLINNLYVELRQPSKKDHNALEAIKNESQLFESRQHLFEEVVGFITTPSNIGVSICISGKWGSGKTSFMNAVSDHIDKMDGKSHILLHLNALQIDNYESLSKHFFSQIKSSLIDRGLYVGIDSEYQTFLTTVVGETTHASIGSLIRSHFFSNIDESNYRRAKKAFSDLLSDTLGNDKLVVIVDDLERCSKDKFIDYFYFISEIISFPNSICIFLSDYDKLIELMGKEIIDNDPNLFMEKFIHQRFDLPPASDKEITDAVEQSHPIILAGETFSISPHVSTLRLCADRIKESKIVGLPYKDETEKREIFVAITSAMTTELVKPRTLTRIHLECLRYVNSFNLAVQDVDADLLVKYLKIVKLHYSIFLLSYIKCCYPDEFTIMNKYGFESTAVKIINGGLGKKEKRLELLFLLSDSCWLSFSGMGKHISMDYQQKKTVDLINALLTRPSLIPVLVDDKSNLDDEIRAKIAEGKVEDIQYDFVTQFEALMRTAANPRSITEVDEDNELLMSLFRQHKKMLDNTHEPIDEMFNIFQQAFSFGLISGYGLSICQYFSTVFLDGSEHIANIKQVVTVFRNYRHSMMNNYFAVIAQLAYYFLPIQKDSDDHQEVMEFAINTLDPYHYSFDKVETEFLNFISKKMGKKIDTMDILFEYTDNVLNTAYKGTNNYFNDIDMTILFARTSYSELQCMESIRQYLAVIIDNEKTKLQKKQDESDFAYIDRFIKEYLVKLEAYEESDTYDMLTKPINLFFSYMLANHEKITPTPQQLSNLDKLATQYYEASGDQAMTRWVRSVLLKYRLSSS